MTLTTSLRWIALLLLAGCSAPEAKVAEAQPVCVLPRMIAAPEVVEPRAGEVVRAQAAYHMLTLSWSPEYCRTEGDRSAARTQCEDNRFGWSLHGLWPNAARGPSPRFCRPAAAITVAQVRENLCMTPSASLLQHEWAAHGTCAWDDAGAYFRDEAKLWNGLKRPDTGALAGREDVTAGDVRDGFVAANPGLPREALFVGRSRSGRLTEVRVCYSLGLAVQACPVGSRGARDGTSVVVTAVG